MRSMKTSERSPGFLFQFRTGGDRVMEMRLKFLKPLIDLKLHDRTVPDQQVSLLNFIV